MTASSEMCFIPVAAVVKKNLNSEWENCGKFKVLFLHHVHQRI